LIGYEPQDNGMDHLEYALQVDRFGGLDNYEYLGAENVLFSPWTGEIVAEDLADLRKRHVNTNK
jgi:hypothetical protein